MTIVRRLELRHTLRMHEILPDVRVARVTTYLRVVHYLTRLSKVMTPEPSFVE